MMLKIKRSFPPGSEWIYFKVYINPSHADEFLLNTLMPFANKLIKANKVLKCFFIRYSDSGFHLRIRLLLREQVDFNNVVTSFYTEVLPLLDEGVIWKYDLSTYSREIERYELPLIEHVETLFSIDSTTILKLINEVINSDDENYRWKMGIKYIDYYLESFYPFNIHKKYELINEMSGTFLAEFGYDKSNLVQLNHIFRDRRSSVCEAVAETIDGVLAKADSIIHNKDQEFRQAVSDVITKCEEHSLKVDEFIGSYIHMMINRLFPEKNRVFELVLYYLLAKHYNSEIARVKKRTLANDFYNEA